MIGQPQHGGQLRAIEERYGIPASELLDFSANINPEGPPAAVFESLRQSLSDPTTITSYPDLEERTLKRALAGYASLASVNVSVSNGFVPLLQASLASLGVRHCLLPVPAFVEYRRSLELAGIHITSHALAAEEEFAYNFEALLQGSHDAVLLANPQNPSGALASRDMLIEFISNAAARNMIVLLDEAFIDYTPAESMTDKVDVFPNLVVFRSVTKFFAVPGLRVAYAVASAQRTHAINRHLAPWPISTSASRAVQAALTDCEFARQTRDLNLKRKATLVDAIRSLGLHVHTSAANFLLLRLPTNLSAAFLCERTILRHQVVLRDCSKYEGLAADHVRVAIRGDAENQRLIDALHDAR